MTAPPLTRRLRKITLLRHPRPNNQLVKSIAAIAVSLALIALVVTSTGCSTVLARTQPRTVRTYPGVTFLLNEGFYSMNLGSDQAQEGLALAFLVDLSLSACVDTLLLPIDLKYQLGATEMEYSKGVFQGTYRRGFEQSDFVPQGGKERWWVTGNITALEQRTTYPVFVVVEAELSPPGRYRQGCRRELVVTKVLELHELSTDKH